MKARSVIGLALILVALGLAVEAKASTCCTYNTPTSTVVGTTTEKICEQDCSQCTENCCCNGECADPVKVECSETTRTKWNVTVSAGGGLNMGWWTAKIGLGAGWESETITVSKQEGNCNTCTKIAIWNGYRETTTNYSATWASCAKAQCLNWDWWNGCECDTSAGSCTKKEKVSAGSATASDC